MSMHEYPSNINGVHIELTDKCQASCPMCARNFLGGAERPFVGKKEITLESFKQWFPSSFLKQLNNFYACGNYGDPIIARDCLEIFQYVRSQSDARLSIHTNGSARTTKWWANLAKAMQGKHDVTFGIDGFKESHVLYRRGTDWDKIIENATAFIEAGGNAVIDCLVFKHNENEVQRFKQEMLAIGFTHVNFKSTGRFYDMQQFPVQDANGNFEYNLEPAQGEFKKIEFIKLDELSNDISIWENIVEQTKIAPKCMTNKEIYVDARGTVYPCCWVGSDMIEGPIEVTMSVHTLRNRLIDSSKQKFAKFLELNLNDNSMNEILKSPHWDNMLDGKPWICAKNCKG